MTTVLLTGRCIFDLLAFRTSAMIDSKLSSAAAAVLLLLLLLLLPVADTLFVSEPHLLRRNESAAIRPLDRHAHRDSPGRVAVASVGLPLCACDPSACIELKGILPNLQHRSHATSARCTCSIAHGGRCLQTVPG
jgi:hypothetical protein